MEGTTVRRLEDSEQAWQLNRLLGAPAACSRTRPRRYAYAGNRPDVAMFPAVVDELVARYRGLAAADTELTVVFDAGQNVAANFAHLAEVELHFVGSCRPTRTTRGCWPCRPGGTPWSTPSASAA